MVKMVKIGQSAAKFLNPLLQGHGKGSETKRVAVANEGLANQMRLKI
jgi:hypothetical protein